MELPLEKEDTSATLSSQSLVGLLSHNILLRNKYYQKYKQYTVAALVVFFSLSLVLIVLIPQILQYFQTSDSVFEQNQRLQNLEKKAAALQQIDESVYKRDMDIVLTALPDDKDFPGALTQLLNLLRSSNLQLDDINFAGSSAVGSGLQEFDIKVDISGDTEGFKGFLSNIRNIPRVMTVNEIQASSPKDGTKIQASLGLQIYSQPLPNTLGKIEQPLPVLSQQDLELLNKVKSNVNSMPAVVTVTSGGVRGKTDPFQ